MKVIQIAQICYEVNRAYCLALGDSSFLPWEEAPQWQRDTNIKGVEFHLENQEAGPEASHESWLAEKKKDDWAYGPVKEPDKKRHPCMVPFGELPAEQQAKDYIFRQIIHSMQDMQIRCLDALSALAEEPKLVEAVKKPGFFARVLGRE